MASRRDRIFAWVGVIVAGLSAIALTGAVVIQQIITDRNTQSTAPTDTSTADTAPCTDTATEETLPVPDAYKPTGTIDKLQTEDLTPGTGAAAKAGACLAVKYYGTLASTGEKFDENFTRSDAFAFRLGQGQVIQGWDQGVVGMKVGGMRRLTIPAALAYGNQAQGSIPANADLVFVVKLLKVK